MLAPLAVAAGLLAGPAAASAALPDIGRIKAWWPMAEGSGQKVHDWSGYRNHGTLGSTPGVDANDPSWVKGIFGGAALRFGGDDFIQVRDSNALENQAFTISLWTRADQSPGQFKYLISKGSRECLTASYGISTGLNGGLQAYVWDGMNQVPSGGAQPEQIWDGKWHHVALTYDGTGARLFLDGKDLGQPLGSPDPAHYDMPQQGTTLGGYIGSCDLLFTGDLDQIMIFNKVLPIATIWSKFGFILNRPNG